MPLTVDYLNNYEPVPESGCWIWLGKWSRSGYGRARVTGDRTERQAHRAFYEALVGPIPAGFLLCHKCDTPACVNPNHMFVGTYADNHDDMRRKSRQPVGASHGMAKLSEEQVQDIRRLLESGLSQSKIAFMLGICQSSVSHIKNGKAWYGGKYGAAA